ncbi:MAG: hypothetical protein K5891_10760 [Lachnospiraceae bacterium]|nr:hypothetical protein [Lachnospiraceae bacterium]
MKTDKTEPTLIFLDPEAEYTELFSDYLKQSKDLPWTVRSYTRQEDLEENEKGRSASLLVLSERAYREGRPELQAGRTVILTESGLVGDVGCPLVSKYQPADEIVQKLLEIYIDLSGDRPLPFRERAGGQKTKFIGIYTPVHRSMQTTYALTLGQMLASEHRVLYLSFEHYAGLRELVPETQQKDLADLLFFLLSDEKRFLLRFHTIKRNIGGLDYIPPMKSGQNLLTIPGGEWLRLMDQVESLGLYDYVLMDLTESMQGLFDILRKCDRVYTLTREDRVAKAKLMQYRQVLALYEYEDVLEKTKNCDLPRFHSLPAEVEQYTRGGMAEYVKEAVRELERER